MAHVEESSKDFGSRIRVAREHAGFSQDKLSQLAKVAKKTIGRWELEQNVPPSSAWIHLGDILGVRAEWLRDAEEPMHPVQKGLAQPQPLHSHSIKISPTRRIMEGILTEELRGLDQAIPELTDDDLAVMVEAVRNVLAKRK